LKTIPAIRLLWLLWFFTVALFIADWLFPLGTTLTRSIGLALLFTAWFGLIALTWRQRFCRFGLPGFTALCAIFMLLPARAHRDTSALRDGSVAGLRRYTGASYYWGGESPKGIDCSGLVRRGLIDAAFLQGIRTLDSGLVRYSIRLWWHDCSARDLGEGNGLTYRLFETPGINVLDHSKILPGDLAVTTNGVHVMAYLGGNQWIEADPTAGHVITVTAPSVDNGWFKTPMYIVRWDILQP